MYKRLFIVFVLGFSSGLPFSLITSTLQAWYSSRGLAVLQVGLLSLLSFPYLFRVLWAPIVDRYSLCALGRRRSWILVMQILLCLGFNLMAWCSPLTSSTSLIMLAFFVACCSSIQDVGIDAYRTEYLLVNEQGIGTTCALIGYRLAMLVAGGFALIMAQDVGWALTYRAMGFLMILGMIAVVISEEPVLEIKERLPFMQALVAPFSELFSRRGIFTLIVFVLLYKLSEVFTTTNSGIVMPFLIQGMGFSLEIIAYLNKVLGVSALIVGGVLAGWLLMRCSLYRALFSFGCLQALTNLLFLNLAVNGPNQNFLAIAVFCENFVAGMTSTAVVVLFMRIVDRRFTATQFSILVAISTLPRIFSGPLGAWLHSAYGWVGLYQWSFILAWAFIPFLYRSKEYISVHDTKNLAFPSRCVSKLS